MELNSFHLSSTRLKPLDQEIDPDLNCQICSEIVQNPQECRECQSLFCKNCIDQWLRKCKKEKCPNGCEPIKLVKPHRKYFSALSKITFSCINENKGCQETVTFNSVQIHQVNECKLLEKNILQPQGDVQEQKEKVENPEQDRNPKDSEIKLDKFEENIRGEQIEKQVEKNISQQFENVVGRNFQQQPEEAKQAIQEEGGQYQEVDKEGEIQKINVDQLQVKRVNNQDNSVQIGKEQWFWKDDLGGFIPYKQDVQNILQDGYQKKNKQIHFSMGQIEYAVQIKESKHQKDQKQYYQQNIKTGYCRSIICVTPEETFENVLWCCILNNEVLKFSRENCEILENGLRNYQKDKTEKNQKIQLEVGPFKYNIDFLDQTQENIYSKMKRQLQRIILR